MSCCSNRRTCCSAAWAWSAQYTACSRNAWAFPAQNVTCVWASANACRTPASWRAARLTASRSYQPATCSHITLGRHPKWLLFIRQGKTARAKRTLPLPAALGDRLRAHWQRIQAERRQPGWQEHGLVFPDASGAPITRSVLYKHFKALLRQAALPSTFHFHDIGHFAASALAQAGVHPAVARDILGHAHSATTLDIYTHSGDQARAQALEWLGGITAVKTDVNEA